MLTYLRVRNLAVLRDVTVELGPGLNVLTGETGAGKSILVDAVGLLMGDRADAGLVRSGAERGEIEGQFEPGPGARAVLAAAGLDGGEGELVVRREIATAGGNRVFINGRLATLSLLRDLAAAQLALHGQNRHLTLAEAESQRRFLDGLALNAGALKELGEAWRELGAATRARAEHQERLADAARRLDTLRHQVREIEALAPRPGEDTGLRLEERRLATAADRAEISARVVGRLLDEDDAVVAILSRCAADLERLAELDPALAGLRDRLEAALVEIEDVACDVRDAAPDGDGDGGRLAPVQERLAALQALSRKYGGTLEAVLAEAERMRAECADLEDGAAADRRLAAAEEVAARRFDELSRRAGRARRRAGRDLGRRVRGELADLSLPGARLEIAVQSSAPPGGAGADHVRAAGGPGGYDRVRFRFTAHAGEELRDLARTASGGELSRLMLALTLVARDGADGEGPLTFIFDEVDAGVGGDTARAVGERLRRVAAGRQVLCVTHLPQVAALADRHLHVSKESGAGQRPDSRVRALNDDERVLELARMLGGGSAPETARRHARALLEGAREQPPEAAGAKGRMSGARRRKGRSATWA
jgi:DNA repair protein RecN (Recombination protein N)